MTTVTLHVSVWVEIYEMWQRIFKQWSRSTWACELKYDKGLYLMDHLSHAPRERVSWNKYFFSNHRHYGVTLHVSVWVEICIITPPFSFLIGHAPRERVSWNLPFVARGNSEYVTLHVSVWVEILIYINLLGVIQSRSTWACELK